MDDFLSHTQEQCCPEPYIMGLLQALADYSVSLCLPLALRALALWIFVFCQACSTLTGKHREIGNDSTIWSDWVLLQASTSCGADSSGWNLKNLIVIWHNHSMFHDNKEQQYIFMAEWDDWKLIDPTVDLSYTPWLHFNCPVSGKVECLTLFSYLYESNASYFTIRLLHI